MEYFKNLIKGWLMAADNNTITLPYEWYEWWWWHYPKI